MANFFSPKGNLEVWDEKPEGYFTELEWFKKRAIEELDLRKSIAQQVSVQYKNKEYQADMASQQILSNTINLYKAAGKLPDNFGWIASDNTITPMTMEELVELGKIIGDRTNELYIKTRDLKNQILQANTVQEIFDLNLDLNV